MRRLKVGDGRKLFILMTLSAQHVYGKKPPATKSKYEVEYRLRRHDGVYRYFMARGVPVFKEDGSIREWVGTCIDITERRKAEQTLKESEEKYRSLVELAPDGIVAVNAEGIVTSANRSFLKLLGYDSEEEIVGKPFTDLKTIRMEDIPRFQEMFKLTDEWRTSFTS